MAKETVNIGTSANSRDGDSLRVAFNKINENFTELYSALGLDEAPLNLGAFTFENSTISTDDSTNIIIDRATTITSDLTIGGDVVPSGNLVSNLGSSTNRFKDLYLSGSTIHLGNTTISVNDAGDFLLGGEALSEVASNSDQTLNTTDEVAFASVSVGNLQIAPDGSGVELLNTTNNIDIRAEANCSIRTTTGNINLNADDGTVDIDATGGLLQMQGQNSVVISSALGDIELRTFDDDINLTSAFDVNIKTSEGDEDHVFEFKNDGTFYMAKNPVGNVSYISTPRNDSNASLNLVSALDVIITSNEATGSLENWTFKTTGIIEFPDGTEQSTAWTGTTDIARNIESENDVSIRVNLTDSTTHTWRFGEDGELTFPDGTVQSTAYVERFVNRSRFTGNATITSGSANLLQFDAYQGSQAFIGPTYQWTPANTGLYRLDFVLGLTGSEVDLDLIVFLYNVTANANQIQLYNGTFTGSVLSMSGTVYLMAGQNFQFGIIQTSGGDITLDSQLTSAGIEELARLS